MSTGHVEGVDASASGLFKATLGAVVAAGAILTFVWLPAEYGIDPTGVGKRLGLTEMGEIKQQLQAEAAAEEEATPVVGNADSGAQPAMLDSAIVDRLDAIESQLAALTSAMGVQSSPTLDTPAGGMAAAFAQKNAEGAAESASSWRDAWEYELEPGEGIEVKLVMNEGDVAEYEWSANGAALNFDKHGDGSGQEISYEQGRGVPEQSGILTAAFTGNHGWYWRNRTEGSVKVSLRTRGQYSDMRLP